MKKIAFVLFACLSSLCSFAQQVWTEGTVWETDIYMGGNYADGYLHLIQRLESPVEMDGKVYYPLTVEWADGAIEPSGFIRTEKGDSLVYIRYKLSGASEEGECLLHDFTKSYEYGDIIRYGCYNHETGGYVIGETIDENECEIIYFHDVLEEGDILPCWKNIIYKIGFIEGPAIFYIPFGGANTTGGESNGGGTRPNASNLSHLVFKTKGGHRLERVPNSIELILVDDILTEDEAYYAADGRQLQDKPVRGMYIHNGKKYIIIY